MTPTLTAYTLDDTASAWPLQPASKVRDWMGPLGSFPYRCLPMLMANCAGWTIGCPTNFTAYWNGGESPDDLSLFFDEAGWDQHIRSDFGYGVVSFSFPYLFQTSPDEIHLRVSGLPNAPKQHCWPLEGLVATAWLPFTFTMNWKCTVPHAPARFVRGEPTSFLQPLSLDIVADCRVDQQPLAANAELHAKYAACAASRDAFNATKTDALGWQKLYATGTAAATPPAWHRTKLALPHFGESS